jgi:hypothetical protein
MVIINKDFPFRKLIYLSLQRMGQGFTEVISSESGVGDDPKPFRNRDILFSLRICS